MDAVGLQQRLDGANLAHLPAIRESHIVDVTSDESTIVARTCDRKSRPTMPDAVSVDAARRGGITATASGIAAPSSDSGNREYR